MFRCSEILTGTGVNSNPLEDPHPSIIYTAYPLRVTRGATVCGTPRTGCQGITGPIHINKQPFVLTFTSTVNFESPINLTINLHVFGQWGEAGVPRENPAKHRENMQTPNTKTPTELGFEPISYSFNQCTTVLPRRPHIHNVLISITLCVENQSNQKERREKRRRAL